MDKTGSVKERMRCAPVEKKDPLWSDFPTMITAVVFDIGMVLADFRYRDYMRRDLGFPEDLVEHFVDRIIINPLWDELDLSIRPHEEIVQEMIARVPGYEREAEIFFQHIVNIAAPYPYAAGWLKESKERGYGGYLLSNYPDWIYTLHERERFDFAKYADGKIISGYEKIAKPDPAIYQLLLSRYHLNASECVFTDDREINVAAAIDCGLHSFVFLNYADARTQLESLLSPLEP